MYVCPGWDVVVVGAVRIRCQAVLPLQHQAEQACSELGVLEESLNPQTPRVSPSGLTVFVCSLFVYHTCVCIYLLLGRG